MVKPIWFVAGSKGGIGKSTVAQLLIDYAKTRRQEQVYLVDTDSTNPDVARPYSITPDVNVAFDTIVARGVQDWLYILEAAKAHPQRVCIINGAAGDLDTLRDASHLLTQVSQERELVVWWVVSGDVESVVLLYRYIEIMGSAAERPHRRLVVTLNPGLGNEKRFRDYYESKIARRVQDERCPVVRLPYLAEDVAKDIRRMKVSLDQARAALPSLRRAELVRFVHEAEAAFDGAFGDE